MAGTRGVEQPVRRRHDGRGLRRGEPVAVACCSGVSPVTPEYFLAPDRLAGRPGLPRLGRRRPRRTDRARPALPRHLTGPACWAAGCSACRAIQESSCCSTARAAACSTSPIRASHPTSPRSTPRARSSRSWCSSPAASCSRGTPASPASTSSPANRSRRIDAMHTRTLGHGLEVSAIGLGCMGMSQSYGPNPGDRDDMIGVLRAAVDRGRHLLRHRRGLRARTSNEELVGEALEPVRDQVVIATKFGWDIRDGRAVGLDSRPEQIRRVADAVAEPAPHRRDRPVLPAPRRPRSADRGRRRRRRRAGRGRARSGTSASPRPAPPPSGAPTPCPGDCASRASTRSGPATRSRRCCRRSPSSASASCRSARSARASSPAPSTTRHEFADGDVRHRSPASPPRTVREPGARRPRRTARRSRRVTPGQVALGLAARTAAVDRADPRHPPARARRRERRRHPAALSGRRRGRPRPLAARLGVHGDRYNPAGMAMVGL